MDRLTPCGTSLREWLPIRAFRTDAGWRLDWRWFGTERLSDAFFFDTADRVVRRPFNQAFAQETGWDILRWHAQTSPGVPLKALIFHASRCGSTLLSQMLASLDSHIVYSEPPMLDPLLTADSADFGGEIEHAAMLRDFVSALGQPRLGSETALVLKLEPWQVLSAGPLLRAFPNVPRFFLYRDPLEIAVSQLREPGRFMVPGLVPTLRGVMRPDAYYDRQAHTVNTLAHILSGGADLCEQAGVVPIPYPHLLPQIWRHLALFGVEPTKANLDAMQACTRRHAKRPHEPFTEDSHRKQQVATTELRELVERLTAPAYARLEAMARHRESIVDAIIPAR